MSVEKRIAEVLTKDFLDRPATGFFSASHHAAHVASVLVDELSPNDIFASAEVMVAELKNAYARIEQLCGGYAEAIDDIESWAAYAGDYFQEKWDLAGGLQRHRERLSG